MALQMLANDLHDPLSRFPIPKRWTLKPARGFAQDGSSRSQNAFRIHSYHLIRSMFDVTGRSVFSRSVRQGTPSTVVSSCTPPESVSTMRAPSLIERKSRYPSGSSGTIPESFRPAELARYRDNPKLSIFFRVRGCMGKKTGSSAASALTALRIPCSVRASSTFEGRCSVSTP